MSFNQLLNTKQILNNPITKQDWPNLEKIIQHMNNYMAQSSKAREYMEAQKAKDKIIECQKQMKKRSLGEIESRLDLSLKEVDQKQSEEIQVFEAEFKKRHQKLLEEYNDNLAKKIEKYKEEEERYRSQLESALPEQPSPDTELHKLRWQEDQYVKEGNFLEAQKMKDKIDAREVELIERHQKMRDSNISLMMKELNDKHTRQLSVLLNRLKEKVSELENLKEKKAKELEAKHAKEIREVKWIFNEQMKKQQS